MEQNKKDLKKNLNPKIIELSEDIVQTSNYNRMVLIM